MREFEAKFGERTVTLAATFKASLEIAEKVGDPLLIMREAMLETMLVSQQIPYEPKWRFTVENVPEIIYIGSKTAGNAFTRNEINDLVFDIGFLDAREIASEYLAMIVGPQPEQAAESKGTEGN